MIFVFITHIVQRPHLFDRRLQIAACILILLFCGCNIALLVYLTRIGNEPQTTTKAPKIFETTEATVTDAFDFSLDGEASTVPFFTKRHPYNCRAAFLNASSTDAIQANQAVEADVITEFKLFKALRRSCRFVQSTFYWPREPLTEEERAFPLAYVLPIHSDSEHIITLLNAIFAPQNMYYITVDLKTLHITQKNVEYFVNCMHGMGFDNVREPS